MLTDKIFQQALRGFIPRSACCEVPKGASTASGEVEGWCGSIIPAYAGLFGEVRPARLARAGRTTGRNKCRGEGAYANAPCYGFVLWVGGRPILFDSPSAYASACSALAHAEGARMGDPNPCARISPRARDLCA